MIPKRPLPPGKDSRFTRDLKSWMGGVCDVVQHSFNRSADTQFRSPHPFYAIKYDATTISVGWDRGNTLYPWHDTITVYSTCRGNVIASILKTTAETLTISASGFVYYEIAWSPSWTATLATAAALPTDDTKLIAVVGYVDFASSVIYRWNQIASSNLAVWRVEPRYSLELESGNIQLVNDIETPTAWQLYGADATPTRNWLSTSAVTVVTALQVSGNNLQYKTQAIRAVNVAAESEWTTWHEGTDCPTTTTTTTGA